MDIRMPVLLAAFVLALSACDQTVPGSESGEAQMPRPTGSRVVTLLATNDIHGGLEPQQDKQGREFGGMAILSGAFHAIKKGVEKRGAGKSGTLIVDAGDQFQGTLLSNYDEGQLLFATMNAVGYDAAVPGNHDYDFGPIGWLDDRVSPHNTDTNPRGALQRLASLAKFSLLSANTFYKDSIVDLDGKPVPVKDVGCPALQPETLIDWSRAKRPDFLQPYVIKNVADVRVALIGLDSQYTSRTTTAENVSDLCFRDEAEAYLSVRQQIGDRADLFVLIVHNGNSDTEFGASDLVRKIERAQKGAVNAVVAGHTHFINHTTVEGVPIIQSSSGGQAFGRIDLVYDFDRNQAKPAQTFAGVRLYEDRCSPSAAAFCVTGPDGKVVYEGFSGAADPEVLAMIADSRRAVAPLARRVLGHADVEITRDRISESPLLDLMTDTFRELSGAEVALINTSGMRTALPAGEVTYEDLFRVLPFSNHGVIIGPMAADKFLRVLERSARTCGGYGALLQSGLRVTFKRDCTRQKNGVDPDARLTRVETVAGEVIYDLPAGIMPKAGRLFTIATLDFIADGGSGFDGFIGLPQIRDLGILREVMVDRFLARPFHATGEMDGRWRQIPQ